MVARDGVPMVPSNISEKLIPEVVEVEGGTNVKVANKIWMIDRKVGGICSSTMRMAMVS
jgi:hypothetical protein